MCNFFKANGTQCKLSPKKDRCWRHTSKVTEVVEISEPAPAIEASAIETPTIETPANALKLIQSWIRKNQSRLSIIITDQLFRSEGELMISMDKIETIYSIMLNDKKYFCWISKHEQLFYDYLVLLGISPMEIK